MKRLFCNLVLFYFCSIYIVTAQHGINELNQRLKDNTLPQDSLVELYHQLTKLYVGEKDYAAAIRATQAEISLLKTYPKPISKLGDAYYNLAAIHRGLAQFNTAQRAAQHALDTYEKTVGNRHLDYASTQVFIAQTYYLQGKNKKTLLWIEKALETYAYQDTISSEVLLKLKFLQSNILTKQFELTTALSVLEQAEQIYFSNPKDLSAEWLARIYNNIAILKNKQTQLVEALAYYQKVINIREKLYHQQHTSLANTYSNIGDCYHKLQEEEKAIPYYRKALKILQTNLSLYRLQVAAVTYNLANVFYANHQLDSANLYIQKALQTNQTIWGKNSLEVADCYWTMAKIAQAKEDFATAIATIEQAIHIKTALLTSNHPELFKLHLDKGLFLNKQQQYIASWVYIAPLLQQASTMVDYSSSLTYFKLLRLQLNNSIYLQKKEQSKTLQLLLPFKKSVQHLINNTTLEGDQRLVVDAIRNVCDNGLHLCYLLYQKNKDTRYLQQAFELMECNKAVNLNNNIQKNNILDTLPEVIQTTYYDLCAAIQAIEYQLLDRDSHDMQTLYPELLEYKKSLQAFQQQYFQQKGKTPTVSIAIDSIQRRLVRDEEQIISYFYGKQFIYAFVIEQEQYYLYQIPLNFDSLYHSFFEQLTQLQATKDHLQQAAQAYEKVATHLAAKLLPPQLTKRLYIIPDGLLNYIPFEALVTHRLNSTKGFHQLQYLMLKHEISYAFSSTAFYRQQYLYQNRENSQVTGFAPTYNNTGLQPIVYAQQEITYLSNTFSGDYYAGDRATKTNFVQSKTSNGLIHLALHGQADNDASTLAKLFFSPIQQDSNAHVLLAHEITACPIRADMITLSGCQTGIGTWRAGEGVISLARDFMKIGIPTVLTTLWQVNDASSSQLIQNFYTHINKNNKAAALQYAKLKYLEEASAFKAHPYFWSGYILIGNTQALDLETKKSSFLWYLGAFLSLLLLLGVYLFKKIKK